MTKVITEHKALSNPGIEVMNHVFASDDVVWISWKYGSEKHVPSLRHTIEEVGAYVSAVYRYFDRLRQKAICCDTDSVIYIQPRDEHKLIETGDKLGKLTYELRPSQNILEFVSGGAKNCAYKVLDTETRNGQEKTV